MGGVLCDCHDWELWDAVADMYTWVQERGEREVQERWSEEEMRGLWGEDVVEVPV